MKRPFLTLERLDPQTTAARGRRLPRSRSDHCRCPRPFFPPAQSCRIQLVYSEVNSPSRWTEILLFSRSQSSFVPSGPSPPRSILYLALLQYPLLLALIGPKCSSEAMLLSFSEVFKTRGIERGEEGCNTVVEEEQAHDAEGWDAKKKHELRHACLTQPPPFPPPVSPSSPLPEPFAPSAEAVRRSTTRPGAGRSLRG